MDHNDEAHQHNEANLTARCDTGVESPCIQNYIISLFLTDNTHGITTMYLPTRLCLPAPPPRPPMWQHRYITIRHWRDTLASMWPRLEINRTDDVSAKSLWKEFLNIHVIPIFGSLDHTELGAAERVRVVLHCITDAGNELATSVRKALPHFARTANLIYLGRPN
jgi:hypothetical protein